MKNFKLINIYDDFKKYFILSRDYVGRQTPEKQEQTCKYFYKKVILIINKDNYILELENDPSIKTTIWYDDEKEAPKLTEQYFINYNKVNLPYRGINDYLKQKERLKTTGGAIGGYDYKGIYLTSPFTDDIKVNFDFRDDKRYFKRYLDNEEQEELVQLIKDLQEKFIARLKRYYKRYSNKIHVCGYWVNR